MTSCHPVEYKSNMRSLVYCNEYSKTKNSTDSSKCFAFEKHSEHTAKESTTEYLIDKRLLDNQVSKTRLKNNQYNKYKMQENPNTIVLKSNHKRLQGDPSKIKSITTKGVDMNGKNNYRN